MKEWNREIILGNDRADTHGCSAAISVMPAKNSCYVHDGQKLATEGSSVINNKH